MMVNGVDDASIFLNKFKKNFKEQTPEIKDEDVKEYVKTKLYQDELPVYGVGAENQMNLLIKKANELGLKNFDGLLGHAGNKQIKESAETILYLLETNKNIDKSLYKDRKFACDAGTLTNLQGVILDISGLTSMDSMISRYKKEVLEQLAREMLGGAKIGNSKVLQIFAQDRHNNQIAQNMEIHDISTILNVLSEDWGIKPKTKEEDHYLGSINDVSEQGRIKTYVDQKISAILANHNDLAETILTKLEVDLPEFDKMRMLDTQHITEFNKSLEEWVEDKIKDLPTLSGKNMLTSASLLLTNSTFEIFGYKDNFRDVLKNCIKLYLDNKSLIQIQPEEKSLIENKLRIEKGVNIEGNITDELIKYATQNDLSIIDSTNNTIDPVKKYLESGDEQKIGYAIKHIKENCEKYGGNTDDIIKKMKDGETYEDQIKQLRYEKVVEKVELSALISQCFDAIEQKNTELIGEILEKANQKQQLKKILTAKDKDGNTPLNIACLKGNTEVIGKILEVAAKEGGLLKEILTAKDKDGNTPLHLACLKGNPEVIGKILEAAAKEEGLLEKVLMKRDIDGNVPLRAALHMNDSRAVKQILDVAKDKGDLLKTIFMEKKMDMENPLHTALRKGNSEAISKILEVAANKDELLKIILTDKDDCGYTPIHVALYNGNLEAVKQILDVAKDKGDLLKIILMEKKNNMETPLDVAWNSGNNKSIRLILELVTTEKYLQTEYIDGFNQKYKALLDTKQDIINEAKSTVMPAKMSYLFPLDFMVKNITEKGTYANERDVLVEEVVVQYMNKNNYKITEIGENKNKITEGVIAVLNGKRDEIYQFLNKEGHYNVSENVIKKEMIQKGNDGQSFVDKLLSKNQQSNQRHY